MTDRLDVGDEGFPRRRRAWGGHYVLVGQTPVLEPDLIKWGEWLEAAGEACVVARTYVGASVVSTVFLGLDHQFGDGPPILFETMVFTDGDGGGMQCRCSTWLEAEAQHGRVVKEWSERYRGRIRE